MINAALDAYNFSIKYILYFLECGKPNEGSPIPNILFFLLDWSVVYLVAILFISSKVFYIFGGRRFKDKNSRLTREGDI